MNKSFNYFHLSFVAFIIIRRKYRRREVIEQIKTDLVPSHIIIRKSSDYTLNDLDTAASAVEEIKNEFEVLEDFIANHVTNKVDTSFANIVFWLIRQFRRR